MADSAAGDASPHARRARRPARHLTRPCSLVLACRLRCTVGKHDVISVIPNSLPEQLHKSRFFSIRYGRNTDPPRALTRLPGRIRDSELVTERSTGCGAEPRENKIGFFNCPRQTYGATKRPAPYSTPIAQRTKRCGTLAGNMEAPSEAEERERMLSEPP